MGFCGCKDLTGERFNSCSDRVELGILRWNGVGSRDILLVVQGDIG